MLAVVTPAEMREIDAQAPEPIDVLIGRAAWEVARSALAMLGGAYGRRVVVIAGPGNNGEDGRVAAQLLARRGVRCLVVEPGTTLPLSGTDLVVDAAYGTGFRDGWPVPAVGSVPVLSVDIPSGVDGLTGADRGSLAASTTVTFGAVKPGLLLHPGAARAGQVVVAPIGLDVGRSSMWWVTDCGLATIRPRATDEHKWSRAVRVVAGSKGMEGAAALTTRAALRAGAGMVVVGGEATDDATPISDPRLPVEAVARPLGREWVDDVLSDLHRFHSLAIGPGLGTGEAVRRQVREVIARSPVPVVVDADAITAVAEHPDVLRDTRSPVVLTPHEGEYARLAGRPIGVSRASEVAETARSLGAIVLLKGPTTLVADPGGEVRFVTSGSPRLATAGSGDVLSGVIAAVLDPARLVDSVAVAAHWHGLAASFGSPGLVAGDLPDLLTAARLHATRPSTTS